MRHARDDYNRIQDPEGKIPENEPVFLLRAQDRWAWMFVAMYGNLMHIIGKKDMSAMCHDWAYKMRVWPHQKDPDL